MGILDDLKKAEQKMKRANAELKKSQEALDAANLALEQAVAEDKEMDEKIKRIVDEIASERFFED